MTPVRLATTRVPPDHDALRARAPQRARTSAGGASWVRFGDELVHIGTERQWPTVVDSARRAGLAMREFPGQVDRSRLHAVVQKGRLFQREHPDVPVLV